MDGRQFDEITRDFAIPTRRSVIAAAATVVLTALLGSNASDEALSKRKQRKAKNKKQKPQEKHDPNRVQASAKKKKKKACKGGKTRCGKRCVDVRADPAHCGRCGNACTGPRTCEAGVCTCIPGACACLPATAELQATIDAASPGATITLCAGTFRADPIIVNKMLTLIGAGPDQTVLDGSEGYTALNVDTASAPLVTVQGLTIKGGSNLAGGGAIRVGGTDLVLRHA
jgi:hypothetical protein